MYSQPNPTNQGKEAGSSSGGQRPSLNSGFTPRVDDFILRQKNHCTLAKPTVNTTKAHDERIANLTFASVYPHYVTKVVRSMDKLVDELAKGRKMEKILRAQ